MIREYLIDYNEDFNHKPLFERCAIGISIIGFLCLIVFFVFTPERDKYLNLHKQIKQLNQENEFTVQQISSYKTRLTMDPNDDLKTQLSVLNKNISELDGKFKIYNIIPSNYMPILLDQVLSKAVEVEVKSFRSLLPKPIVNAKVTKKDIELEKNITLYSHGIMLHLNGDYFSVLRFLKSVEMMSDKLYWKSIDYRVNKHPNADVTLEFYTLSVNKDFISVSN